MTKKHDKAASHQPIGKGKPHKAQSSGPVMGVREPVEDENADTGAGIARRQPADEEGAKKEGAEAAPNAPGPVGKGAKGRIRAGHLYSTDGKKLYLQKCKPGGDEPTGEQGDCLDLAGKCKVEVNGVETTADDLKRGDHVHLTGEPVTEIAATR